MTRRRPGAAKGGGSPPPETDDFGRERALREGDPPPLPKRETDVFEGPGEGSGAPGDLKSRVHASKSMTCPVALKMRHGVDFYTAVTVLA